MAAMLKGHHGKYEKISFVPLPVEYVAPENVKRGFAQAVKLKLPTVLLINNRRLASSTRTHGYGRATSSNGDESEVDDAGTSHNSRVEEQAAVELDRTRSLSGTRIDRTIVPATVHPNTLPAPTRRRRGCPSRMSD